MKRIAATLLPISAAFAIFAADPYIGYIYPAGIQRGTTNRLVIGGQILWGVASAHFSNPGLHLLNVEKVPNFSPPTGMQRKHLKNWLDGIAEGHPEEPQKPNDPHMNEWRTNTWWNALDKLDRGQIAIVEHDLFTPRNALQSSPSLRQMILLTVAADADAELGECSLSISSPAGISAPRPFMVSDLPHFTEPLYVPPHRPQPDMLSLDLHNSGAIVDGQIMPGSTDTFLLHLAAGRPYSFKVTARELQPYIGDAVPGFFNAAITLKGLSGRVVAQADDDARFRPDPVLRFTPPDDCSYLLEIHDVLYRGRADFVYSISIDPSSTIPQPSFNTPPAGIVSSPGFVSRKTISIDSPGPRVLEVTARRNGSPLDAVLTLRRCADGPVLAQWDDVTNTVFTGTVPQEEYDPIGTFDFPEAGEYVAEVTDRTGHGGADYAWWLDVRRPKPDFEVLSSRSTLPLKRGRPVDISFHIIRKDGFDGRVKIEFADYMQPKSCVATSGVDVVKTKLQYSGKGKMEIGPVELFASATIDGRHVRKPVIPCDEYEQAFAWHHLVPAKSFLVRCGGR